MVNLAGYNTTQAKLTPNQAFPTRLTHADTD